MRSIAAQFGYFASLALGLTALAGCPIYGNGGSGGDGGNQPPTCWTPEDCGTSETCGTDNQCHSGDCAYTECVYPYQCEQQPDLTLECVLGNGGAGGGGGAGGAGGAGGSGGNVGGGGGSPPVIYCGNPDDCALGSTCGPDGACHPGDCVAVGCVFGFTCNPTDGECKPGPNACGSDADCTAPDLCVSGFCTAPDNQCADGTQCGSGQKCAAGKCVDGCVTDGDCSASYLCDIELGVCTVPAKACTITNDCGSASQVCVDGACVPESNGGTCTDGVWVENGCIPNQSATFVCNQDGVQDVCAVGSVCLHKSCYISCEAPNQSACVGLVGFNQCKSVTTSSGPHSVCGSSENLGGECDPTLGQGCPIGICIDGYCK